MATIVYLDVDDEITSAAARLREADESRVALVLPYGSRLATSRMNFRLLAREAAVRGRRLVIVAPDAGTRALAGAAGLPVFASVTEYEESLEPREGAGEPRGDDAAAGRPGGDDEAGGGVAGATTAAAGALAAGAAAAGTAAAGAGPAGPLTAGAGPRPRTRRLAADRTDDTARDARPTERTRAAIATPDAPERPPEQPAGRELAPAAQRRRIGAPAAIAAGILALALVVAAVAGYVYLPAATVTIAPRVETVPPITLTVTADPTATEVDAANAVIPASTIEVPVTAAGEYPATGKRVEQSRATGTVRFDSINTVGPVEVPSGTRVSTLDGVVFSTTRRVVVPRATVAGDRIEHGIVDAPISANRAGPEANVDVREITQVPDFLRTQQVSAFNPNPTTGGAREEFPQVTQEDVDAAVEQLTRDLGTQFAAAVDEGGVGVPEGATLFAETAVLGDPTPSVDPATLVGQEVATFTLELAASGTVLAVDERPIEAIAAGRLESAIEPGHELVEGSTSIEVGEAVVEGQLVRFPVTATVQQIQPIDAAAVEAAILGLQRADAEAVLARFGEARLELWPDWVSAVPSIEQRVEVVVDGPAATGAPSPATSHAGGVARDDPVPSAAMSLPAHRGAAAVAIAAQRRARLA